MNHKILMLLTFAGFAQNVQTMKSEEPYEYYIVKPVDADFDKPTPYSRMVIKATQIRLRVSDTESREELLVTAPENFENHLGNVDRKLFVRCLGPVTGQHLSRADYEFLIAYAPYAGLGKRKTEQKS